MSHIAVACLVMALAFLPAPRGGAAGELDVLRGVETLDVSRVPFRFEDLQGKAVVVVFFASWCPPCTAEFNEIAKARVALRGKPWRAVAVNLFEAWGGRKDAARMDRFIARTKPAFPLVEGNEKISAAFGNVDRIPTMVVLSPAGREVWRFVHVRNAAKTHATAQEVIRAVNEALAN